MRNSPAFMEPGKDREIALLKQKVKDLEHEIEQFRTEAKKDIKSSLILGDKQKATEIKFRLLKGMTRAMRKMGKQMGLAARYMAQSLHNVDPGAADDMRFLADVLERDYWGHEVQLDHNKRGEYVDLGSVKASDLIKQTQAYKRAKGIAHGKDAND